MAATSWTHAPTTPSGPGQVTMTKYWSLGTLHRHESMIPFWWTIPNSFTFDSDGTIRAPQTAFSGSRLITLQSTRAECSRTSWWKQEKNAGVFYSIFFHHVCSRARRCKLASIHDIDRTSSKLQGALYCVTPYVPDWLPLALPCLCNKKLCRHLDNDWQTFLFTNVKSGWRKRPYSPGGRIPSE